MSRNRYAMVTRCDSNATQLAETTHPILADYAKQWGCDFIILDGRKDEDWMKTYEDRHYRILQVKNILGNYERAIVIDSDIVIMPGCPNPFDLVDEDKIGSIYEDVGSREAQRQGVILSIQERFGDVGWEEGYINTGFFIVSRKHADIFEKIDGQYWTGFGYDDAHIGWNIHMANHEVQELPFQWNHMSMFSESWNNNANRFDSWIIHYAGRAIFPDDQSGRSQREGNEISARLTLIKNDIERITTGLMTFQDAVPTEIQGQGSRCFDVKMGVQKKPIVLKVPATPQCLTREIAVLNMRIPNTVTFLGMGEDPGIGKFLMLEKLFPLPEEIGESFMKEIIATVLITSRQLYKLGIPWICRAEHIMLDESGNIKLLDFGDDPYMPIPFYGKTDDEEAIIMDGDCCKDGMYQMRYKYPLSGFVAVMKNLLDRSGLLHKLLLDAEKTMIAHEYQTLKDVHQPIFFEPYKNIMRTETELNDKNFGKLVPANRNCEDRADMIFREICDIPIEGDEKTWLDIGCNVGWFCFEFSERYKMTGIDFDIEKIIFNKMLAEGNRVDIEFMHADVDINYVDTMPEYDIISVLSMLHLKLVKDKDEDAFWELFVAIAKKTKNTMFFEFPPHSYSLAGAKDTADFIRMVKLNVGFSEVINIGQSDAGRPLLKCIKEVL